MTYEVLYEEEAVTCLVFLVCQVRSCSNQTKGSKMSLLVGRSLILGETEPPSVADAIMGDPICESGMPHFFNHSIYVGSIANCLSVLGDWLVR